jgi:hypothetical protein
MWLVPHDDTESNKPPWLEIDLGREEAVSGLIVHNYNKSEEDTLRGAKMVSIELDGRPFKSVQLRPAPGRRNLNFGQLISFSGSTPRTTLAAPSDYSNNLLILNDYETLQKMPSGSYLRFVLHGSWGDATLSASPLTSSPTSSSSSNLTSAAPRRRQRHGALWALHSTRTPSTTTTTTTSPCCFIYKLLWPLRRRRRRRRRRR